MRRIKRRYRKIEDNVHSAICKFLKLTYPHVVFHSDPSGEKLTIGQAVAIKAKRSNDKIPDLFIAEPSSGYHGLYIEIKKNKDEVFTKKGKMRRNKHIEAQYNTIMKLKTKGYYATFGLGFDATIKLIDAYMKNKL